MDISVVVLSYNPEWNSIKKTVESIVCQKGLEFELIVADDGSKQNYFDELKKLFESNAFSAFKLVKSEVNQGTCKNTLNGVNVAEGRILKLIAPGDFLADDMVLYDWLHHMKKTESDISFGRIVYYDDLTNLKKLQVDKLPHNLYLFENSSYDEKKAMLNYIFLRDDVPGCDFLVLTSLFKEYLCSAIELIKYAEDMVYRMMIIDGFKVTFFEREVIWYEYGTGISTGKSDKWKVILDNENWLINRYMITKNKLSGFKRFRFSLAMRAFTTKHLSFMKYLVYPELIILKVKKHKSN